VWQSRPWPSYHAEGGRGDCEKLWGKKGRARRRKIHTVLLHDLQELDNDLGGRADHDLALAGLLGVVEAVERIVEDGGADHFGGCCEEILKP